MKKQNNKKSIVMLVLILAAMAIISVLSDVHAYYHLPVDALLVINCFLWSRNRKTNLAFLALFPLFAVLHYSLSIAGYNGFLVSSENWIFTLLLLTSIQSMGAVVLRVGQLFTSLSESLNQQRNFIRISVLVDIFYVLSCVLILSVLLLLSRFLCPGQIQIAWLILSVLLFFLEVSILIRFYGSNVFLFLRKHEDRLLQSASPEMFPESGNKPAQNKNDDDRISVYADVYGRLIKWFEEDKPYLEETLTLNDAARETYTNKVYLSRAISKFSKKNFCQFVNCYRIRYAKQLFLSDMTLRVSDLAVLSGFHNPVTFNMAFQMFENITPGDWCNDQRSQTLKMKK